MFDNEKILILEQKHNILKKYFEFLKDESLSDIERIAKYCDFFNNECIKPFHLNEDIVKRIETMLYGIDVKEEKAKVILRKKGFNLTYVLDEIKSSLKTNHNIPVRYIDFLINSIK